MSDNPRHGRSPAPGAHRAGSAERVDGRGPRRRRGRPILRVRGLSKTFRGLTALSDYDLDLPAGRIHGVIGPNGAGKTTLFNLLSGFLRPTTGTIAFEGQDITGWPAYKVARLGIARTFQNIRLFGDLTVLDNVIGRACRRTRRDRCRDDLLEPRLPRRGARARGAGDGAARALSGIAAQRDRLARNLPYGDQRRLEIARAVASGAAGPPARRAQRRA